MRPSNRSSRGSQTRRVPSEAARCGTGKRSLPVEPRRRRHHSPVSPLLPVVTLALAGVGACTGRLRLPVPLSVSFSCRTRRFMPALKLTLAYDGADFHGWQSQPGRRTIQETLERVLSKIAGHPVVAVASGRTDAGVHALRRSSVSTRPATHSPVLWHKALNAELPHDLAVPKVEEAGARVSRPPRRGAKALSLSDLRRPGVRCLQPPLRLARLSAIECRGDATGAALAAGGQARFRQFPIGRFRSQDDGANRLCARRSSGMRKRPPTRRSRRIARPLTLAADGVEIKITADGFLYNMVRIIVGTLVQVGRGVRGESWPAAVSGCGRPAIRRGRRSAARPVPRRRGLRVSRGVRDRCALPTSSRD